MMVHCHKHENQLKMRAKVFKVKCGHVCIMDESLLSERKRLELLRLSHALW